MLYIIYFKSSVHLMLMRIKAKLGDVAISHKVWEVPEGGWETIYHNHNALKNSTARMRIVDDLDSQVWKLLCHG
jgi:hypothetical protein